MKNLYLDNADNALQNYLDNDNYHDKIMIGYELSINFGFLQF